MACDCTRPEGCKEHPTSMTIDGRKDMRLLIVDDEPGIHEYMKAAFNRALTFDNVVTLSVAHNGRRERRPNALCCPRVYRLQGGPMNNPEQLCRCGHPRSEHVKHKNEFSKLWPCTHKVWEAHIFAAEPEDGLPESGFYEHCYCRDFKTTIWEKQDVESPYGLHRFCVDSLGTSSEVRMVLPDGTRVSKAEMRLVRLTDGSEVYEVAVSQ
jgi:hypothetical protein